MSLQRFAPARPGALVTTALHALAFLIAGVVPASESGADPGQDWTPRSVSADSAAPPDAGSPALPDSRALRLRGFSTAGTPRDWYVFVAAVNVYPRLESEAVVDDLLEPVLALLGPGHRGVHTISDLRDDHLLWPPHVGVGLNLNRHWSIFVEAGYTTGKVRTKNDRTSILLLPLHTDFEIKRSGLFAGVGVDYFPWGMPAQRDYAGLGARLAQARPFLGSRLTWTHATYDAKVKIGFRPFPNVVNLEFNDAWTLPSVTVVAGVDVPLTRHTTLTLSAGYNYFWERDFDFEGYAFTIQWRRYIGGPPGRTGRSPKEQTGVAGRLTHR